MQTPQVPPLEGMTPLGIKPNTTPRPNKQTHYDYDRQVWVVDGLYVTCGHLRQGIDELTRPGDVFTSCSCFGRLNAGRLHECGEGCP